MVLSHLSYCVSRGFSLFLSSPRSGTLQKNAVIKAIRKFSKDIVRLQVFDLFFVLIPFSFRKIVVSL